MLAGHYVTVSDLKGHWQISFHDISFSCAKGACSEGDDARRTDSVVGKDDALNETDFQTRMVIAQEDAYRLHVMPSEGSVELHTANAKAVQQKTISSIPSAAVLPLPTAADPMQTRWMATERAAQRFIAGVMQRVPLATVNHTETDDVLSVAPSIPHVSCIVAASDVVWVESTLIEVGAVPTALDTPDSTGGPMHNCCFIDVVIDDNASSWERGLQQHRSLIDSKRLALLLEILVVSFPAVTAGQVWILDGPESRLLSFVSFPDDARVARDFVNMLYGALDVDPLAIEEVEVQYEPLAFPMINRIIRVEYGLTRAVERPALAYEGKVLGVGAGEIDFVTSASRPERIPAMNYVHGLQASVGSVISSQQRSVSMAYAMTAGHVCANDVPVRSSECDTTGCCSLKLQYVSHSDHTHYVAGITPIIQLPNYQQTCRAVADIALFSFQRVTPVREVSMTQPLGLFEVTFPSDSSWKQIQLHGYGRQIDDSPGGEREYLANGYVFAPTSRDPLENVRHCLYLAAQTKAMRLSGLEYVDGHSGSSVFAGPRDAPTLHSFVCQLVNVKLKRPGRFQRTSFAFQGLTPAALALEQARRLLSAADSAMGAANITQLRYVETTPAPARVSSCVTCEVS